MTAWLAVTEERRRGVDDEGRPYVEVAFAVTGAYGVEREVFVHDARRGTFQYVAMLDHLGSLPADQDTAVREGYAAYRAESFSVRGFTDAAALKLAQHVRTRLSELLDIVNGVDQEEVEAIPGSVNHVFGGDS